MLPLSAAIKRTEQHVGQAHTAVEVLALLMQVTECVFAAYEYELRPFSDDDAKAAYEAFRLRLLDQLASLDEKGGVPAEHTTTLENRERTSETRE